MLTLAQLDEEKRQVRLDCFQALIEDAPKLQREDARDLSRALRAGFSFGLVGLIAVQIEAEGVLAVLEAYWDTERDRDTLAPAVERQLAAVGGHR